MANPNLLQRMTFDVMITLDYTDVTVDFTAVGSALANPAVQFMISNFTNTPLVFSFDGSNDHFVLAAGAQWINDNRANRTDESGGFYLPVGVSLWAAELTGAPASGAVYFSVIYGGD